MKEEDKSVQFATMTILHAGNARNYIADAYKALLNFDYESANTFVEKARQETLFASREQSKIISTEMEGEALEFSLLLTHAQDTLMSATSEIHIVSNIINLVKRIREAGK